VTNYNDGKWHAWPGGECPVHPDSEIEAEYVTSYSMKETFKNTACGKYWKYPFLFRVTKEYKAPCEYWIVTDYNGYTRVRETEPVPNCIDTVVHVREVAE
jgi:hypothetical protein